MNSNPLQFVHNWTAEVLSAPPLIAPARHFVYPQRIPGEEETLSRGALHLHVSTPTHGDFLATCALGFDSSAVPTGLFSCPHPDDLCAIAGGYGYIIRTTQPLRSEFLSIRPVIAVLPILENNVLIFVGFHTLLAYGRDGQLWQSARLTWEGVRIAEISNGQIHGFGWDMPSDTDIAFTVDLATGHHTGGAFNPSSTT